jgi:exonuclease SbcC
MRLRYIGIRDLGPFKSFSVDLSAISPDAQLVAVVGPNGAGKSTLLELWTGGGFFRECRTRGSLASLATSRAASLEVQIENGHTWTIRHTVDAVSGKGESVAFNDATNELATSSGKVRDFDAWAAKHLPSPELLYGSQVLAQGSGGFLDLKPGDRKAVVLRLLGVERLEPMAKAARDQARDIGARITVAAARIGDLEKRADVADAGFELAGARERLELAQASVQEARQALDVARELAGNSALAVQRYREQCEALEAIRRRHEKVKLELGEVNRRIANNRAVLAQAEEIRAAVRERDSAPIGDYDKAAFEAHQRVTKADADLSAARREAQSLVGKLADLEARQNSLRKALAREVEVRAAVAAVSGHERVVEHVRLTVSGIEQELDSLRGQRIAGADERISGLRHGLTEVRKVACSDGDYAYEVAKETLEADDAKVELVESLPRRVAASEEMLIEAKRGLRKAEEQLSAARATAALAGRLDEDRTALEDVERQVADARTQGNALDVSIGELLEMANRLRGEQGATQERANALRARIESLRPLLEREKPLQTAEARLAELEPQASSLAAELAELAGSLERSEVPVPPGTAPDVARQERELADAQERERRAAAGVGSAETRLADARRAGEQVVELSTEIATLRAEQSDWTRLGEDLGRDGLQAALVDSACAQLTALTNDLLHSCVGSRWTVTLETQRASADGKKQIEGFDVRVLDTEAGRDTTVETLSGGERVLVGEAISLALTTLTCQRAGVERPTLVRDETGAALDPAKARAYVAMLRRAAKQIGADRVLFVSHSREVQELADATIQVGG